MAILDKIIDNDSNIETYASLSSFPALGKYNTFYIALDTGSLYYWTGSAYQEITQSSPIIDGEVNTYADLPAAASNNGDVYLVKSSNITASVNTYADLPAAASHNNEYYEVLQTTTSLVVFNRKPAGIYLSNATTWNWINTLAAFQQDPAYKQAGFYISNGTTWNPFNIVEGVLTYQDVDTDSTFAANSDYKIPSQKAVKTSIDFAKARANHTGTQTASTISDFNSAALAAAPAETTTTIGSLINGATEKPTPVDNDMVGLMDSAASNILKKLSWSNIKATLKTYFDTLYQSLNSNLTTLTTSTLGDIIYSSATNTLAKLAGNTTTTKKYLTQTGNGANSAAPVWGSFNADVIASVLTGFSAAAGTVASTDTILQGLQKIVGNLGRKLTSVAFAESTDQQRADGSDITFASGSTYTYGSGITISTTNITFSATYAAYYLAIGWMNSTDNADPAYGLTYNFNGAGVLGGVGGRLESNANGTTTDKGVGGQTPAFAVIDTSSSNQTITLRKQTSGSGSSSPGCRGSFIAFSII